MRAPRASSNLREELGKRLYILGNMLDEPIIEDNPFPVWEMAGSMKRECWRALADECIRQMEWARTQDKVLYLHHGGATVGSPPLTLAPDDWRAE